LNIEEIREYCLSKPGVEESFPFGDSTLVFKVGQKIFLLVSLDKSAQFNAKSDPDRAVELREEYDEIQPGFHMNKKHWITVSLEGRLNNRLIREIMDDSYTLVWNSLPQKLKPIL
jgi:predicted DNA-binding protein (MmcQ/YjbR family)